MEKRSGLTFQFIIGSWGGFYCGSNGSSWRICLGWFAISLWFTDLDYLMEKLLTPKADNDE